MTLSQLMASHVLLSACKNPRCDAGEFENFPFDLQVGVSGTLQTNLESAKPLIRGIFLDLQAQCKDESKRYVLSCQIPSVQKRNRWDLYTNKERLHACMRKSLDFVASYPESRVRQQSEDHLRFLVLLQHLVAEDTGDFSRPEGARQHNDTFEGFLTKDCVNSQLIKDAHRSEWSVEGRTFLPQEGFETDTNRKQIIAAFQKDLVTAVETFLLSFCQKCNLSQDGTKRLLQAVTTQMSQCGLANLDRSSKAAKYFVSGQGLEQRITYNLSSVECGAAGEYVKLSLLCMKTGFHQYRSEDALLCEATGEQGMQDPTPTRCAPSSYLYQYATLRFTAVPCATGSERIECTVIDALDEVHIYPVTAAQQA